MAKLDVNENEGENGKDEHQVPHLGEYGETYAVIVLLSKRSIMKTLISLKMRLLVGKVPITGGRFKKRSGILSLFSQNKVIIVKKLFLSSSRNDFILNKNVFRDI